ncbi:eCIS core domain-containing protein [Brasilonema octagenarum]|uniref:eCIS core domain-containing protein n=1 Tax=Brasilonema octagenarum UFV-OR1 TaxID=417115 RepID=A0ABX1M1Y3_9CYAN|nr:DUF4157 domain-containing protein [Brasilonema octagenarum]NMF62513.1 hypothetical protein [Brasilonema octagenarum UFV-OR1]
MNKRLHIHKHKKADSFASNPVRSQFQSRPFIAQAQPQSDKPLSQRETENQEFQQHQVEATKLKLHAKYRTITPEGQERLTVLQAKMSGLLHRRLQHASSNGSNFANIPISRPDVPSKLAVQTKLTIGEPGDKYEQEADRVAAQIVKQINTPVSGQAGQNVQREEISEEEKDLQMKPMLQLKAAEGEMTATAGLETAINQARGGGQPLADNVRKPMEQFLGADFSRVKVHTDTKADQLSRAIQARAFTTRQDVFFGKGEYNPASREGQKLIFHEVAHVAQQNGSAVQRSQSQVTEKSPPTAVTLAESAFGADTSGVKVHTDAKSDQLNKSIQLRTHSTNTLVQKRGKNDEITETELHKKVSENPELWYSENPELWVGFEGIKLSERLKEKNVRKVNRISGLIKKKFPRDPNGIRAAQILDQFIKTKKPPNIRSIPMEKALPPELHPTGVELNRLIGLALNVIYPKDVQEVKDWWANYTRQWKALEEDQKLKVIAHRGDGATFDKMGEKMDRREFNTLYYHQNENSSQSTDKFLRAWSCPTTFLSGIECDVRNTRDMIPYVTHTEDVQGIGLQEINLPPDFISDIAMLYSDQIPERFLTLEQWLHQINFFINSLGGPNALQFQALREQQLRGENEYFDKKNRLRIEIEMKAPQMGDQDVKVAKNHWQPTNKVVSQFLKNTVNSGFYDIAMFNNTAVPFSIKKDASKKTYLSQVTFGAGGSAGKEYGIREWRIGLHLTGTIKAIEQGKGDGKIITISPGLEHPGIYQDRQLQPSGWANSYTDMTIEQAIQSVRYDMIREAIERRKREKNKGPLSLHVLTDHGNLGAQQLKTRGLAVGHNYEEVLALWNSQNLAYHYPGAYGKDLFYLLLNTGLQPTKQEVRAVMLRHPDKI